MASLAILAPVGLLLAFIACGNRWATPSTVLTPSSSSSSCLKEPDELPRPLDLTDTHVPCCQQRVYATQLLRNRCESLPHGTRKLILLLVTGNPGTAMFYAPFMQMLSRLSNHQLDVRCFSLAAHHPHDYEHTPLYDLTAQVEMWQEIVSQCVRENPDAHFAIAGHSIGAYIALQTLPRFPKDRFVRAFFMFPTLHAMKHSPNGRALFPIFKYARHIAATLVWCVRALLPVSVQRTLVNFAMDKVESSDTHAVAEKEGAIGAVLQLLHPKIVHQLLYLAKTELMIVDVLQHDLIKAYESQISFIFSPIDKWNPAWHQAELIRSFPTARVHNMDKDCTHAFVVGSSRVVAACVWRDLNE